MTDGIVYAASVPLTPTEAALGDARQVAAEIPVIDGQTIVASVKLTVSGYVVANSCFVFMQTALGDGTWVDVAWCYFNGNQGTSCYVLCGGGLGAMNNAFTAGRQSGAAPTIQANGSNQMPLGGRVRFTGFAKFAGGSSNVSGTATSVSATITYRLQHPR